MPRSCDNDVSPMKLSHHDKHMLAAKSGADVRTVQKWWERQPVARSNETAITMAAKTLGIARPPLEPGGGPEAADLDGSSPRRPDDERTQRSSAADELVSG